MIPFIKKITSLYYIYAKKKSLEEYTSTINGGFL